MLEKFYPSEIARSAYEIPYEKLYEEGYRGLIFDIDNTLVPHDAPADDRSVKLFARLKEIGFKCCLLSNNNENRVQMFNKDIHAFYISGAGKPSAKSYIKAVEMMDLSALNTVAVGDQLLTDILGAKNAGIRDILVTPIAAWEPMRIRIKRVAEKIIFFFYHRRERKKTGEPEKQPG